MKCLMKCSLFLVLLLTPAYALAENDVSALRRQLEEQRTLILEQRKLLQEQQQRMEKQARDLDKLGKRLEEMEKAVAGAQAAAEPHGPASQSDKGSAGPAEGTPRDGVGDLNTEAVRAGDFPGAIRIPGTKDVSLAIGGFIKTVVIHDTNAEQMGADFLPSTLGTRRPDKEGATSIDATISRVFLDGRAPARRGQLRGYLEADLNETNDGSLGLKMRHAYGTWKNEYGTLLAGHTWSTMMDLKILPEGLTEPTVSGAIFQRQALVRWSQPIAPEFTFHAAVEDPNSSDVFSNQPTLSHTSLPDGVLGLEYDRSGAWHFRLNGIARNIKVEVPGMGDESETGWGLGLSGHLNLLERDRLTLGGVYGKGLGRYLLGIQSTAGGALNPLDNDLELRKNWGAVLTYQHHWAEALRSNVMGGYAHSEALSWQPADTFESSKYGAINLMWNILPYLTVGIEYGYGVSEDRQGEELDNHRIMVGFQYF